MRMQVKLEIGHKAACRVEPTPEGFTHDWTVFVRGSEGKDISHFVEKVVFHLHESFPKPKRGKCVFVCVDVFTSFLTYCKMLIHYYWALLR